MKHKIISAGHICLDITPVFSDKKKYYEIGQLLEPGKLIHVNSADVHTGGSVANTGLALKVLGNDVTLMGKVGCDAFGNMIEQILADYDVDGLLKDEESSTSYSVVLAIPGLDRIFLHNPGANDTFCVDDIKREMLNGAEIFHFGYPPLMKKMYENDGEELVRILKRAKEEGLATSLDFAAIDPNSKEGEINWISFLNNVLSYTDFFVPSFEELLFMLDRKKYDSFCSLGGDVISRIDIQRDVATLADQVIQMGCKVVLIKCGTKGMYYKSASKAELKKIGKNLKLNLEDWESKEGFQPCFIAETVKSETGAGDTSIAAFLTAIMQGEKPQECVKLAAAEGACAVTTYDAISGLQSIEKLKEKIQNGWATY